MDHYHRKRGDSPALQRALRSARHAIDRLQAIDPGQYRAVDPPASLAAVAERLYVERRIRERFFPRVLFGEPAWDMLLALFMAHERGDRMTPEELYRQAGCGVSSGPRLVSALEQAELVVRKNGVAPETIDLSDNGHAKMAGYLMQVA